MGGRYYLFTYGCQMNKHDSEAIMGLLEGGDYERAEDPAQADLILLNTCSIREKCEQKVFSQVGRLKELKKKNPSLRIGVCGCLAQREGGNILRKTPSVDLVFGTQNIEKLPLLLDRMDEEGRVADTEPIPPNFDDVPSVTRQDGLKAWVSIARGCDHFCTFCVVPYTRGPEWSKPSALILREVQELAEKGYKEVTLLGQNVNSYGKKTPGELSFARLLAAVNGVEGIERIRFVTSHPMDLNEDLVEAMASLDKVCEHLHLPLQAGSDGVLCRMQRGYTAEEYLRKVERLRREVPGVSLTSDIIVGFPGESDADFRRTVEVLDEVQYDSIFLFKFSPRPGTPAAHMGDQVPEAKKDERFQELNERQKAISLAKNQTLEGTRQEVLVEGPSKTDPRRLTGRTRTNKVGNFIDETGSRGVGSLVWVEILRGGIYCLEGVTSEVTV
ncbi:MAG: tRNA (N6-isopentenyl adenosine(37)-C2)-methylthiotransferase MiaB [Nitrospinota bacterium]